MIFNIPEQLAGFCSVQFYLLSETSNWPVVITDANAGQIVITPEINTVEGSIVEDSITVNDKQKSTDNGTAWPIAINFTFLARNRTIEQYLEQYAGKPGIAIVTLNDTSQKLMGTDQLPLYLAWENNYGTKVEDGHGVNIEITGNMSHRPRFYTKQ